MFGIDWLLIGCIVGGGCLTIGGLFACGMAKAADEGDRGNGLINRDK